MSTYAASCKLGIERRTVPGETERQVVGEIQDILDRLSRADRSFAGTLTTLLAREPFEVKPEAGIVRALAAARTEVLGQQPPFIGDTPWMDSAIGIIVGGGTFLVIILASGGGMGGGDMKLGAMLGAFLGWKVVLLTMFIAVVLGGALAVALIASGLRGRKDPIPFGPFLAAGGAVSLFWGERVVRWYLDGFAA